MSNKPPEARENRKYQQQRRQILTIQNTAEDGVPRRHAQDTGHDTDTRYGNVQENNNESDAGNCEEGEFGHANRRLVDVQSPNKTGKRRGRRKYQREIANGCKFGAPKGSEGIIKMVGNRMLHQQ